MTATLIDVTDTAREAGILRWPVAITQHVQDDCVTWTDGDTQRTGMPQDEADRLWDVLWMAGPAVRTMTGDGTVYYLRRVPRDLDPADLGCEEGYKPPLVMLRVDVVIGDDRTPRLVISNPELD